MRRDRRWVWAALALLVCGCGGQDVDRLGRIGAKAAAKFEDMAGGPHGKLANGWQTVCASVGDQREWLRKVRPWWGHHDHFHVRLPCPADSPLCEAQAALPQGDGCGELGGAHAAGTVGRRGMVVLADEAAARSVGTAPRGLNPSSSTSRCV